MTPSCTHALEMAALLLDITLDDEIILPSFTFPSTANAFALRGAKLVFVDVDPDTMNISPSELRGAITEKTKAIVIVHYAGVICDMDRIVDIADTHGIAIVEDAAQAVLSEYRDRPAGSFGQLAAFSFHETKNYSCGEGGMLVVNDSRLVDRAEIIREKGTNRSQFFRGMVAKYSWIDIGSSYLVSDISAAYLYAQLIEAKQINSARLLSWTYYHTALSGLEKKGLIKLPSIPSHCKHNAHMFYIKCKDLEVRSNLIEYLNKSGVTAVFHYLPLHSSEAGLQFGRFSGEDVYTTKESNKLFRLPMFYGLTRDEQNFVVQKVEEFYADQ